MLLHATQKAKQAAQIAECHNYRRQMTIYYYADTIDESDDTETSYLDLILDPYSESNSCRCRRHHDGLYICWNTRKPRKKI